MKLKQAIKQLENLEDDKFWMRAEELRRQQQEYQELYSKVYNIKNSKIVELPPVSIVSPQDIYLSQVGNHNEWEAVVEVDTLLYIDFLKALSILRYKISRKKSKRRRIQWKKHK